MSAYSYSIASDFPNAKVAPGYLKTTVQLTTSITKTLTDISASGDVCTITFADALSGAEETTLDGLVAAHAGVDIQIVFHATSKLVDSAVAITEDQTWQTLGGVVTNLAFFVPDLTKAFGRVVASAKTNGSGAELRVVEDNGTDLVMLAAPFSIGDTADAWTPKKLSTDIAARGGDCTYRLEGRLNGATSASVRFTSMTLLEKVLL